MPCDDRDLCSYEDVKLLIGSAVAGTIDDDTLRAFCYGDEQAMGMIARCSRLFETKCGIEFQSKTETFYLSGKGTNRVLLPEQVYNITALTLSYQTVGSGWEETTNFDWTDSGIIRLTGQVNQVFWSRNDLPRFAVGVNNIRATVTYGYATVPDDVRAAVAMMVAIQGLRQYNRLKLGVIGVAGALRSRRLGDREESWGAGGTGGGDGSIMGADMAAWQSEIDDVVNNYLAGVNVTQASRKG